MPAQRLLLIALCLSSLSACAPTTPLFIAQVTTHEVVEYKTLKTKRMAAAIEEEGDLLTYSAMAIRDNHSAEAEALYLQGYNDQKMSNEVRAIALYQIGLIYMNPYNEQRNDTKAATYFTRINQEFPSSRAASRATERLTLIQQREHDTVQKSSRELLATWQPDQQIDLYKPTFDDDMTLLSRRALLKNRIEEAEEFYLLGINDPHVAAPIKEKALYQLALMHMAADNPTPNRDKAARYLRRLLSEYPKGELNTKAARHLDRLLNNISP